MMMSHMQKLAVLDSAAACAVQLDDHTAAQQHISTHNKTREVRFANTSAGSAVSLFIKRFLLRNTLR
jgi:hypothetical protein